jgi:acetylornithine/succinyldiaminopimelate/putrescine aminotransferase
MALVAPQPDVLMHTYPLPPVTFVSGEGSWLIDSDGRRYLDLLSGLAVTSLGHSHPDVAYATAQQAHRLCHVSNLFGNEHGRPLALAIDELLGGGGRVFLSNCGASANECAIKLARKFGGGSTGRYNVLSAWGSFHGRTLATLHATGQPAKWEAFQPLPDGFRHGVWNDFDDFARQIDDSVAAVLLEPVQGEGGVNPADRDVFAALRELCSERGVLFMVDEVQTGLGRTGRWFGWEHFLDVGADPALRPDVVTLAKALGNGMPIGACWARAEVADVFEPGDHATTFGGQPLAAATARAVLDVMQHADVPHLAERAGERFATALEQLETVREVRGLGLLLAVELDTATLGRTATEINAELLAAGVVANAVTPSALRLAPSLLISDAEIDTAVSMIASVLGA